MEYFERITNAKTGAVSIRPYTEAEIAAIEAQKPIQIRIERDMKLETEVDVIAGNALRWAALTAEQQQAWADYRQALLDVPQQAGFPDNVVWPTKPE